MGLNENDQESGGINKKVNLNDDQEPRKLFTITNVADAETDADMGLNYDVKPNKINFITGTQDDTSELNPRTGVTQDDTSVLNIRTSNSNK